MSAAFSECLQLRKKASACGNSEQCTASENVPGERHPVLRKLVMYLLSQSVLERNTYVYFYIWLYCTFYNFPKVQHIIYVDR